MFRFIHSSDLHLGKPYGQMPEDIRGNLTEARFAKIEALSDLAEREGATHILLAGDTFDAETPSDKTRRQAIRAMARDSRIRWVIIPGNHDSLAADELWRTLASEAPENVTLALEAQPMALADGIMLLPAPCPARRSGRDLGAWMDEAATPEGTLRIGLAHGGVQSFAEDGSADTLAPDRAARAGLDYLALGDWHGQMQVEPRTWYSGTPEADQFKHAGRAGALVVTLTGSGALPQVQAADTGEYLWQSHDLSVTLGTDAAAQAATLLPPEAERRKALLRFDLSGRIDPAGRGALIAALEQAAPDFAFLDWRERDLRVEYDAEDLDQIDQGGVLRAAAETLRAEADDADLSAADRAIARRALNRLYGYAVEAP
jgi:DNA repair exonuclease SbcCD nuclease subunit